GPRISTVSLHDALPIFMTMVDTGRFVKYEGLGMLPGYTIEPGDNAHELKVVDHSPQEMHRAIARAMGLDDIEVLSARLDAHSARSEEHTPELQSRENLV